MSSQLFTQSNARKHNDDKLTPRIKIISIKIVSMLNMQLNTPHYQGQFVAGGTDYNWPKFKTEANKIAWFFITSRQGMTRSKGNNK